MSDIPPAWRPLVAVHEAAHVVVALANGIQIQYVTMNSRNGGSLAHVRLPRRAKNYQCHHVMATSAAGAIAMDIANQCRARNVNTRTAGDDFAEVRYCARLVRDAQQAGEPTGMDLPARASVRQIAEVAWRGTYRTVVSQYGAITALAEELLASPRALTGRDCQRIIDGADTVTVPEWAPRAEQFWPGRTMPGWWNSTDDTKGDDSE
jgi:hypothetical protein